LHWGAIRMSLEQLASFCVWCALCTLLSDSGDAHNYP
jgi:hypothetical protein